jgi:hypothetical protein
MGRYVAESREHGGVVVRFPVGGWVRWWVGGRSLALAPPQLPRAAAASPQHHASS